MDMRLTKDCTNTILEECKASLVKTKVSDADAEDFWTLPLAFCRTTKTA